MRHSPEPTNLVGAPGRETKEDWASELSQEKPCALACSGWVLRVSSGGNNKESDGCHQ